MLFLYLLAMQLVQSDGGLTCLFRTYSTCSGSMDRGFCTDAPQVFECLKEKAPTCEVTNADLMIGLKHSLGFQDNCHSEDFFNKECFYNVTISDTFRSCFADVDNAINKSRKTGNKEANNLPIIEFDCRYNDSLINCSERTMALVCGNDTNDVFNKEVPHNQEFIQRICGTNRAADFRFSWISLLLQTSTVIFVFKLSNFYARVTIL